MMKLTNSQLIILSGAACRDDGVAAVPPRMTKAAALKVGASLTARKLMREMRAKPGMPVWRENEAGGKVALVITKTGRSAIGIDDEVTDGAGATKAAAGGGDNPKPDKQRKRVVTGVRSVAAGEPVVTRVVSPEAGRGTAHPRNGSKQALLIEMLDRKTGAGLDALVAATGWLPHTTRAILSGLRKRGYVLERTKSEAGGSVYRIASRPARAA